MLIEKWDVVHQELPLFLSLGLYVKGCELRCPGCHSIELWHKKGGIQLTETKLEELLNKYVGYVECIIFFGGEWEDKLVAYLKKCHSYGLKTCLFTGQENVSDEIKEHLDYIKVGKYVQEKGGLNEIETNQRMIEVKSGRILNDLYRRGE